MVSSDSFLPSFLDILTIDFHRPTRYGENPPRHVNISLFPANTTGEKAVMNWGVLFVPPKW